MSTSTLSITYYDLAHTLDLAARLGKLLQPGDVIALEGELGAGKTTFTQGLAQGMGIDSVQVNSPTFIYHQVYTGKHRIHHMDWYRIDSTAKLIQLDLLQFMEDDAICIIEWFSKHQQVWLFDLLTVKLTHVPHADSHTRHLEFHARGERFTTLLKTLEAQL